MVQCFRLFITLINTRYISYYKIGLNLIKTATFLFWLFSYLIPPVFRLCNTKRKLLKHINMVLLGLLKHSLKQHPFVTYSYLLNCTCTLYLSWPFLFGSTSPGHVIAIPVNYTHLFSLEYVNRLVEEVQEMSR